jgi:glycosyltransferase involved in cell wall biosynthesis
MISLCIPNYNRSNFVISSFLNILHDERINEIIISDDCSEEKIFNELSEELKKLAPKK